LTLLAALLLALTLVELTLAVISPLQGPPVQAGNRDAARTAASAPVELLTERNLFASSEPESGEEAIEDDLPVTTLRLVLRGVTPNSGDDSRALIETPNGKQVVISEGETILPGVTLRKVETWRAVINRNGRLEALLFQNRPEIANDLPVAADPSGEGQAAPAPAAPAERSVRLRDVAGPFLAQLTNQGFEPDDIPTAIDGRPLPPDRTAMTKVLQSAYQNDRVSVTVLRDGEETVVQFSLPQGGDF
jgi:type II secretory pathway component PulC